MPACSHAAPWTSRPHSISASHSVSCLVVSISSARADGSPSTITVRNRSAGSRRLTATTLNESSEWIASASACRTGITLWAEAAARETESMLRRSRGAGPAISRARTRPGEPACDASSPATTRLRPDSLAR